MAEGKPVPERLARLERAHMRLHSRLEKAEARYDLIEELYKAINSNDRRNPGLLMRLDRFDQRDRYLLLAIGVIVTGIELLAKFVFHG